MTKKETEKREAIEYLKKSINRIIYILQQTRKTISLIFLDMEEITSLKYWTH